MLSTEQMMLIDLVEHQRDLDMERRFLYLYSRKRMNRAKASTKHVAITVMGILTGYKGKEWKPIMTHITLNVAASTRAC